MLTYKKLKKCFEKSERVFRERFTKDANIMRLVIETIAKEKNDNGWPLGMLNVLVPELAEALKSWTAGGYEGIRREQEISRIKPGSNAHRLETYFPLLPKWDNEAYHFSKDNTWFCRFKQVPRLELKSFMGCCSPGHSFAYVSNPAVVLKFSALKTARLVGALTTENCEGEVLLPRGATFRVASIEQFSNTIFLEEE